MATMCEQVGDTNEFGPVNYIGCGSHQKGCPRRTYFEVRSRIGSGSARSCARHSHDGSAYKTSTTVTTTRYYLTGGTNVGAVTVTVIASVDGPGIVTGETECGIYTDDSTTTGEVPEVYDYEESEAEVTYSDEVTPAAVCAAWEGSISYGDWSDWERLGSDGPGDEGDWVDLDANGVLFELDLAIASDSGTLKESELRVVGAGPVGVTIAILDDTGVTGVERHVISPADADPLTLTPNTPDLCSHVAGGGTTTTFIKAQLVCACPPLHQPA